MADPVALPSRMNVTAALRRLNIALVYGRMPLPMTRADQMTVAHLIAYLAARGHAVDLFTLDTGEPIAAEQQQWLAAHCRRVAVFPQGTLRSLMGSVFGLCRGLPLQVGWFTNGRHIAAVRRAVAAGDYDVAYTYYIRNAEALRGLAPAGVETQPATFLALQLSQTLNTERIAARATRLRDKLVYGLERRLMRRYEVRIWREFTRTVLIGSTDLEAIRAVCRSQGQLEIDNHFLCAHGVDVARFRPRPELPEEPATLVFSGVMRTNTNIEAVTWFARHCWQRVKAVVPEAKLVVVGRSPPPAIMALAAQDSAITVTGEVPDPTAYLARATVCINPMQAGAGMQNKLIEYLAMGRAVVATPVANEGIGATPGEHLLIAATAEDFARMIVRLLKDPARRESLGAAGRDYVRRNWTWERWFHKLETEMMATAPQRTTVRGSESSP